MRFRGVIFDLDGTLAYTAVDLRMSMNRMLTHFGYPTLTMEEIMQQISCGERDFVRLSLPPAVAADAAKVDACLAYYAGVYDTHFLDNTTLYDGLFPVLKAIEKSGMQKAVNTNKSQEHARAMLDRLTPGMFPLLKGDGAYPSKPDPTGALAIAEAFGLPPAEICYIGDSHVDMETAQRAGMFPIGVTWGYREESVLREMGAKAIARQPAELLSILSIEA